MTRRETSDGEQRLPQVRRYVWFAIACAAALVIAIFASVTSESLRERAHALDEAGREALTLAHSLADNTYHVAVTLDVALSHLGHIIQDDAVTDAARLQPLLTRLKANLSAVDHFFVLDGSGRLVADTTKASAAEDALDARVFELHRTRRIDGLHVGEPLREARSGDVVIPLSLAVRDTAGDLLAVVVATLGPSYFDQLYSTLDVGPGATLMLAHRGGAVITRYPENGSAFDGRALFGEYLSRADAGSYVSPPQSDGELRVVGYQAVNRFDLVVAIALHHGHLLAPWREGLIEDLALALLLSLAILAAVLVLVSGFRREARFRHAAEAASLTAARRARQQHDIAALSQFAATADDDAAFLTRIADAITETLNVEFSAVLRTISSGTQLLLLAGKGWEAEAVGRHLVQNDVSTHAGYALQMRQTVVARDYGTEQRFPVSAFLRRHGARSGAVVPVISTGWGSPACVTAVSTRPDAFSDDDILFLEAVAHLVGNYFERRLENRLRDAMLHGAPGQIAVLDEEGEIVLVNQQWMSVAEAHDLGLPAAGLGANYLEVCARAAGEGSGDARRMLEGLSAVMSGRMPSYAMEYAAHHGETRQWFRALVSPIDFDRQRGAVIMHVDVTERRLMEQQLRESQRMEALGQLTGGVAHDFNNLLTVVLGNAELLGSQLGDEPRAARMLQAITGAAERGAALTDRLLSYARRQRLDPAGLAPDRVLAEVAALLDRTLREDIELVFETEPDCPPVFADPVQLQTALVHLIVNARDAMPDGGTITVSAGAVGSGGVTPGGETLPPTAAGHVCLSVTDTGTGMDEHVRRRAFEPFFTTKGVGEGTGLGLSMVQGFALQSDGLAEIESEPGQGTTVTIYLPAATAETRGDASTAGSDEPPTYAGLSAVVVEDEPRVREYLRLLLEDLGFRVHVAESGREALRLLDDLPAVDIVLSDVIMPGELSGYGLIVAIRERRSDLPVVLMSGYADPSVIENLREYDATTPLLRKPFTGVQLNQVLRQALAR